MLARTPDYGVTASQTGEGGIRRIRESRRSRDAGVFGILPMPIYDGDSKSREGLPPQAKAFKELPAGA